MTYPNWNTPHDPYYDDYSIEIDTFSLPNQFDMYLPDFGDEVGCKSIIMPSPRKGAINFIKNNKFMVVGIYADSGRPDTAFPLIQNVQWSISSNEITFFDATNKARIGDYVYCYNTNITGQQYLQCVDRSSTYFTLKLAGLGGSTTGINGSYQIDRIKSFITENIVFRLFPTFSLIKYSDYLNIVSQTDPNTVYQTSSLIKNITSDTNVRTPIQVNSDTDYTPVNEYKKISEIDNSLFKLDVEVKGNGLQVYENNQTFDDSGKPLRLMYDSFGKVISPNYYDSKYKNKNIYVNSQISVEVPSTDPTKDDRVWCYDFYNIDINDSSRNGAYNRDDIISRDTSINSNFGNIKRLEANGVSIYPTNQDVYDEFGNVAVGINSNNTLNVVRQRIPIRLDNFGRPLKLPQ